MKLGLVGLGGGVERCAFEEVVGFAERDAVGDWGDKLGGVFAGIRWRLETLENNIYVCKMQGN